MSVDLLRITEKDTLSAAGVHARAFLTDPYTTFMLKDPQNRSRKLYALMVIVLRYACRYGEVYATPGLEAVAAWLPPGSGYESTWRMIRVGALPLIWRIGLPLIRTYTQVEALAKKVHERNAHDPHWYLSQLGVEPGLQGKGFGQMALKPTLKRMDQDGLDVYLETHNPRALPFYKELGFQLCEEVILPGGGPPMWAMLRKPQRG